MVFQCEGHFQQFIHCKFRENVISVLFIPRTVDLGPVFLVVNKWGKVGIYNPDTMGLLHTFCLNLLLSGSPSSSSSLSGLVKEIPKCQRTHLIIDAIFAHDFKSVIFATSKSLLQCYDIGEIEDQNLGLEILPRKEFMRLKHGQRQDILLRNKGFVETHQILNLDSVPSCLHYCPVISKSDEPPTTSKDANKTLSPPPEKAYMAKILIGDVEGCITVIIIRDLKFPFGRRKIRGTLAKVTLQELRAMGHATTYKAHNGPIRQIHYLESRHQILSCSRDKKFSLFSEDFAEIRDSFIISLPKGVNTITYCNELKIIVTGSEDAIIRIFNSYLMRMPQMELQGHKAPIIALEMLKVPFSESPLLISFSEDVEIRAWDAVGYACLQSLYLRFPPGSTIMCKTPEFTKHSLVVHQPHFKKDKGVQDTEQTVSNSDGEGFIILLYCNAFAKLRIENNTSHWPFDFEEFLGQIDIIHNTAKAGAKNIIKVEKNQPSMDPKSIRLSDEEKSMIEERSREIKNKLMEIKNHTDDMFGTRVYDPEKKTLALKGTEAYCALNSVLPFQERMLQRKASIFEKLPYYEIPDVQPNCTYPSS